MTLRNSTNNKSQMDGGQSQQQQRHASTDTTSGESWHSTDTVRGPFGTIRGTPMNTK